MRRSFNVVAATVLACGLGSLLSGGGVSAATFPVTNNDAAGPGSFAQAVLNAAASPGPDVITFDPATNGMAIPGDVTINGHDVEVVGNGTGATILAGELTVNTGLGATAMVQVSAMTVDRLRANSGGAGSTTVATFTDLAIVVGGVLINSGSGSSTSATLTDVEVAAGDLDINSGFDGATTTVTIDGSSIAGPLDVNSGFSGAASTVTIDGSSIAGGITTNSLDSTTDVSIVDSAVAGPSATLIRLNESGTSVEARSSTFADGAIGVDVLNGASFVATNSTFSGLTGTAIASTEGSVTLQNVTIADVASGFDVGDTVSLEIGNTIITGVSGDACVDAPPLSSGGNFADDTTCALAGADDQQGVAVVVAPLADNGGATLTRLPADGSPVIDGGVLAGCPVTDQRGVARPQDGDNDTVTACDAGAVEIAGIVATTTTIATTTTLATTTTTTTTTTTIAVPTTTLAPTTLAPTTLAPTTLAPTPILPPTGRDVTSLLVALALLSTGVALTGAAARRTR